MMKTSKVYLVGTEESLKTNQWQAMTPSRETAEEYKNEKGLTTIKEVEVKPRRQLRKKRK